jgi:hypothetical protein
MSGNFLKSKNDIGACFSSLNRWMIKMLDVDGFWTMRMIKMLDVDGYWTI